MQYVAIGNLSVSKLILGGNPISAFSHQSLDMDRAMSRYFTTEQTKRLFRDAESLGINTFLGRGDRHIIRLLQEYWDQGGQIRWIAQTCPEMLTIERSVETAYHGGASACYIHGGMMDHLFANNKMEIVPPAVEFIRSLGLPAGIAAHNPQVIRWAEENLNVDFYMCSYYDPFSRVERPDGGTSFGEDYDDRDRDAMVRTIATLSRPAIHYKVLAAGRKDPREAFPFVARHLRQQDAVCIGIYDEHNPDMLKQDVELLEASLADLAPKS